MSLDHLETLLRQAQIDAKNPQSRLKIIGSTPQTRYVRALYANGEALIAGCKAVAGIVEAQDELLAAIDEILDDVDDFDENHRAVLQIRRRIHALFGERTPANDRPAGAVLKLVQP